jgi:hypothetical protein
MVPGSRRAHVASPRGTSLSRAVCRNCWTWYSKGETACPNCHVALTAADAGAEPPPPPTAIQPPAAAPLATPAGPSRQRINWLQSAIAGILLIGLIVGGVLLAGALGPAKSSDGAFSVKVPTGWAVAHGPAAGTVLALAGLRKTAGIEPHFIVGDPGQFVPLAELEGSWQTYAESGQFPIAGTLGSIKRMTLAGTLALTADFQGSTVAGELIFVDYGSKTYIIEMSSDIIEFPRLRKSDLAAILSSWEWH